MTQNVYFSLMTHTKQLLLVKFSYTTAGIGVIGGGRRTDRRGSRNSYLDERAGRNFSSNSISEPARLLDT